MSVRKLALYKVAKDPNNGLPFADLPETFTRNEGQQILGVSEEKFYNLRQRGYLARCGSRQATAEERFQAMYKLLREPVGSKVDYKSLPNCFTALEIIRRGGSKHTVSDWLKRGVIKRTDVEEQHEDPWHPRGAKVDLRGLCPLTGWQFY